MTYIYIYMFFICYSHWPVDAKFACIDVLWLATTFHVIVLFESIIQNYDGILRQNIHQFHKFYILVLVIVMSGLSC